MANGFRTEYSPSKEIFDPITGKSLGWMNDLGVTQVPVSQGFPGQEMLLKPEPTFGKPSGFRSPTQEEMKALTAPAPSFAPSDIGTLPGYERAMWELRRAEPSLGPVKEKIAGALTGEGTWEGTLPWAMPGPTVAASKIPVGIEKISPQAYKTLQRIAKDQGGFISFEQMKGAVEKFGPEVSKEVMPLVEAIPKAFYKPLQTMKKASPAEMKAAAEEGGRKTMFADLGLFTTRDMAVRVNQAQTPQDIVIALKHELAGHFLGEHYSTKETVGKVLNALEGKGVKLNYGKLRDALKKNPNVSPSKDTYLSESFAEAFEKLPAKDIVDVLKASFEARYENIRNMYTVGQRELDALVKRQATIPKDSLEAGVNRTKQEQWRTRLAELQDFIDDFKARKTAISQMDTGKLKLALDKAEKAKPKSSSDFFGQAGVEAKKVSDVGGAEKFTLLNEAGEKTGGIVLKQTPKEIQVTGIQATGGYGRKAAQAVIERAKSEGKDVRFVDAGRKGTWYEDVFGAKQEGKDYIVRGGEVKAKSAPGKETMTPATEGGERLRAIETAGYPDEMKVAREKSDLMKMFSDRDISEKEGWKMVGDYFRERDIPIDDVLKKMEGRSYKEKKQFLDKLLGFMSEQVKATK